ncbi:NAD-dependent epimerase/dehydratase family protein [Maribellus sp. YY47]|uniref:NAD-dependent epimerase/dehydratase family protein n=1 Tax=Maribellus sp. YY47 TaxID=2929486 RepID=UPI0020019EA6|nr:NAD-dependent epimerase/dehydratase family protein [Maribellus sp. YY47]MCK3683125.1 NAD-dependent epimerase/dehydratase family protein [Maribellus sp. YY47]
MKILVTGTAGFIGFHLVNQLVRQDVEVVGIDNINDYYSPDLKFARLAEAGVSDEAAAWNKKVASSRYPNYSFVRMKLEDREQLNRLFETEKFDLVCNLAAQAGVRYSIENPQAYIDSNIVGFANILEACRHHNIQHLVYASSSSVYGNSSKMPLSTTDAVDNPVSLYAATKKSNELMAHTYSHLYGFATTGLRFFTVYGPWGRPDMAYFSFTKNILDGKPIKVFNQGELYRDFTYIDDIVDGIIKILNSKPKTPYKVYNIGNSTPVKLVDFIGTIETALGKEAAKEYVEMQPGDVYKTFADVSDLENDFGYAPDTPLEKGIGQFVKWYVDYYR